MTPPRHRMPLVCTDRGQHQRTMLAATTIWHELNKVTVDLILGKGGAVIVKRVNIFDPITGEPAGAVIGRPETRVVHCPRCGRRPRIRMEVLFQCADVGMAELDISHCP